MADNPLTYIDSFGEKTTAVDSSYSVKSSKQFLSHNLGTYVTQYPTATVNGEQFYSIRDLLAAYGLIIPNTPNSNQYYLSTGLQRVYYSSKQLNNGERISATLNPQRDTLTLTNQSRELRGQNNYTTTITFMTNYMEDFDFPNAVRMGGEYYMKLSCFVDAMARIGVNAPIELERQMQAETMMKKLRVYYDSKKITILTIAGTEMLMQGYEPAFVAGMLANIEQEGTVGRFESSNYGNENKKPSYLKYMDENYNYRQKYSGKNITDFRLDEVYNLLLTLEKDNWKGRFGLGMIQWTAQRAKKLVETYMKIAGNGKITFEQAIQGETQMILSELNSSAYKHIYPQWKNDNIRNLKCAEAAYNAGYAISLTYVKPGSLGEGATKRGNIAIKIYKAMFGIRT